MKKCVIELKNSEKIKCKVKDIAPKNAVEAQDSAGASERGSASAGDDEN